MDIRHRAAINIRRIRRERGLSQEEFGDIAGIDRTYVSGVERGVRNPSLSLLQKFAEGLGVDPVELIRIPPNDSNDRGTPQRANGDRGLDRN